MQRKFTNDDFEQFLKMNADQLRMTPSSSVWKSIAKELNGRSRRVYGLLLLFVSFLAGSYFMFENLQPITAPLAAETTRHSAAKNKVAQAPHRPVLHRKQSDASAEKNRTEVAPSYKSQQPAQKHTANYLAPVIALNKENLQQQSAATAEAVVPAATANQRLTAVVPLLPRPEQTWLQPSTNPKTHKIAITALPEQQEAATTLLTGSRTKKLTWQLFLTPTISYRKLSENKSFARPILTVGVPSNVSALYNINNAVTHKPDLGLEFGVGARYQVSKNLKIRSGFQFNINRYDIKAFSYVPEVATIALRNGYRVDSVNTISSYRNFNGGKSNWLQNLYFQASVPVGLELKVHGNNKMHVGIASTVQPTYIIGERAYMITADYKNYAKAPWLIRHWNVATNFETFVSYSTGHTQWQIGPQVRYQLLSSFISEYPVKENLFDFGLKVGVTLNQQKK